MTALSSPSELSLRLSDTSPSVTLSWIAPVNGFEETPVTNYIITFVSNEGDYLQYMIPGSLTEHTASELKCNIEYQATIKASNDNGSTYGPEASFNSFTLLPFPPSAPTGGGYMYISSSEVSLAWGEPVNNGGLPITNYLLTITPTSGSPITHNIEATNTYFTLNNLQHGINVSASVKASNDNGVTYGPECNLPIIVPINTPPSPPSSAQAIAIASGTADITWSGSGTIPEGKSYYLITSVSSNPEDTIISAGTADLAETSCRIKGLNPMSEYYFKVKIINPIGTSSETITNTIYPTNNLPALSLA